MNRIRAMLVRIATAEPAPPWSLATALLTLVFAFVAMLIGVAVALAWGGNANLVALVGWTLGGFLILAFFWQTRRDLLRLPASASPILFVMFVALGLAIALDLVTLAVTNQFLPVPELLALNPNALGIAEWIAAILFMVIVQPLAEGLVFRAMLLPALRSALGAWGGILAAAVLAGVFHMLIYTPNYNNVSSITPIWYGLISPMLDALFFNVVRGYTKSTRASIAAHIAFGIFAVIKLLMLTGAS